MAEVIITEFIAETGQFVAAIDKAEASVIGLDQAEKDATKSTAALTNQLGSSAAKAEVHRNSMKAVADSSTKAAAATDKTAQSIGGLRAQIAALEKRKLTLVDPKEIAATNQRIDTLRSKVKELDSVGTAAGKNASSAIGGIGQAAQQAIPPVGGIGGAFTGILGPIGLAVTAVVGGFAAIIKNTDAGQTAIDGIGRSVGFTFDRITGLAKRFGDSLKGLFTGPDGEANTFISTLNTIQERFTYIITLGGSSVLRNALKEDVAAGQAVAEQLDDLQDKQLGVNEATAKNEITIRKNLSALRDSTKPVEERLRLADEITEIEETNLKIKRDQLRAELKILETVAAGQQLREGEVDDDLKAQISGIRTAIFDIEAESVSLTERVASRRAGIVEQEEQRKKAAREKAAADAAKAAAKALADEQKAAAAREKAAADEKKRIADTLAAEKTIAEVRTALALSGLDDLAKRDAAVRASFEKQIEIARAAFAQLATLATTDSDRAEIAARETAVVLQLAEAERAELERLRQQDLQSVRDYARSKEEIEIEAINKRFDLQVEQTKKLIQSEEERTAILKAIEEKRQAEISGIITAADQERLAQKEAEFQVELGLISGFAQASSELFAGIAQGQEDALKNFSKTALSIAFDAINAMVPIWVAQATGASLAQPDSVATFGAAGLARAAVLTALIKGVLAGLRGTLGFAEGGEVTKRSGPPVRRSNGDNVLATLQDREIVLSRASRARAERMFGKGVWGDLGVPGFGGSIDWSNALAKVAASNGPRDGGASPVFAGRDDRRIIGALGGVGSLREQRRQTELLEELARTRGRNPRSRWA